MTNYAASHLIVALTEEEYKITEPAQSTILDIYDRFNVDIPYSTGYIKVRVLFNALSPLQPPDIIILYPILNVKIDYIKLFRDWNPSNRRAFVTVFDRIKCAFSDFYLEIFQNLRTSEMARTYTSSLALLEGRPLELLISYNDEEILEVIFSLPVPVTLAHESCTRPVLCNISVQKSFDKFSADIVYPNWATHLHQFNISSISNVSSWPISRFDDVMRQLYKYLKKEINALFNSKDQRAIFFNQLSKIQIGVPLEVDTVDFLKMSFHTEIVSGASVEYINIVIILEKDFPKTSPIYKLRGMNSIRNNELREKKYPSVKGWDMDYEISALADLFKKTITENLKTFLLWINS